ncbi:E3 ubiquitin-protein ligase Mdm2-like [Tropilaelaps mercedesae]|uniref:E3 ubiquitin-protein ligase Mdm2-like n=1 Tax=Tropilaelaps mercedesae TaxID=418985 RepID=A0A1V9WYH9_9ACAR|nr:E3 ubiquitin-protein ligase Mdm2-like [Tropilaelaps mercedesae]
MYLLDKAFLRILEPFGLGSEPVAFHTIVRFLKQYIVSRGLFHMSRPDVILCGGDPLGTLFKKVSFTNREAVGLIRKHISPVFTQKRHDVELPMCVKPDVNVLDGVSDDNKASSSEEETVEELDVEIAFSEPGSNSGLSLFEEFQDNNGKLIVGSLSSSDSLSELDDPDDAEERTAASVVSILSNEYNEFEPLSDGGSDDDLILFSSDSDLEIHIVKEKITVESVGYTEEDDFFADSSDAAISNTANTDYTVVNPWFCKCQDEETKSSKGFCHSCWTAQFGWRKADDRRVPPSVQRRKRAKRAGRDGYEEGVQDAKRPRVEFDQLACDREAISSPLGGSSEDTNSASQDQCSGSPTGGLDVLGSCIMCESRSRNTALVHGRSAHVVACYKCSRKLQEKGVKCPHCRRIVERVVRLYV